MIAVAERIRHGPAALVLSMYGPLIPGQDDPEMRGCRCGAER